MNMGEEIRRGDGDSRSPPSPAPLSSSGVIVQVGPGSSSSDSTPSSSSSRNILSPLHLSPVTTPPAPAPSNFNGLFGVHSSNPLSFPAFSSNVTLTSNHVRANSQDAAFVPNSSSTNITLPVFLPTTHLHHNHHQQQHYNNSTNGIAPLAVLSSPSLGSTPTSPTTVSAIGIGNNGTTVSIDIPTTAAAHALPNNNNVGTSSLLVSPSTLPGSASSSSFMISSGNNNSANGSSSVISEAREAGSSSTHINLPVFQPNNNSHTNSNAIIPGTCSLNQSIAAGGITGSLLAPSTSTTSPFIPHQSQQQHCLLVSCNNNAKPSTNLISTEAQTDNNNDNNEPSGSQQNPALIAPPPPSRSREHRKRERRDKRRDRSNNHHNASGGEVSRHHRHHHHSHHRVKSGGTVSSSKNGHASSSSGVVQQSSSSSVVGSGSNHNHFVGSSCVSSHNNTNSVCGSGNVDPVGSELHSEHGGEHSVVAPSELGGLGPPPGSPLAGMPDILDPHFAPPPYSTLPHQQTVPHPHPPAIAMGPTPVPIPLISSPVPVPLMAAPPPPTLISPANCIPAQPVRYHFTTAARASRRSMRAHRGVPYASEEEPKTCCGMSASQAVSIRWFIIVIAVIGICCTLAGTALGAARSAGKEHLTLSLLMIGVGVLLLTVSAVAWRLTANESGSSCRAMLGFARSGSSRGDGGAEPNRRFVPRLPPSYGRPHHPYAAMMYPEFQYRQPPPSYQASMQEYRLRLLLLERSNPTIAALGSSAMGHGPVTMLPPPPYRPYSANMRMLPHARVDDYSRPPSYRSRSSGNNTGEYGPDGAHGSRPSLDPGVGHNHQISHPHHLNHHHIIESPMHSRDPSLLSYLSQQSVDNMSVVSGHGNPTTTATVVTVVQAVSVGMDIGLGSTLGPPYDVDEDGKGLPAIEGVDDKSCYDSAERDNKDGNLVRIVQTTDSSQVIGRDSVIVTVSGSNGSIWDAYHHHASSAVPAYAVTTSEASHIANSPSSNGNIITTTSSSGVNNSDRDQSTCVAGTGSGGSEVQILAHL